MTLCDRPRPLQTLQDPPPPRQEEHFRWWVDSSVNSSERYSASQSGEVWGHGWVRQKELTKVQERGEKKATRREPKSESEKEGEMAILLDLD